MEEPRQEWIWSGTWWKITSEDGWCLGGCLYFTIGQQPAIAGKARGSLVRMVRDELCKLHEEADPPHVE